MIGSGLKKLAQQYGMKIDAGVAYGSLMGYATAMFEGAGYKQINITTAFPEVGQKERLMDETQKVNLGKEYRVSYFGFVANGLNIVFHDTVGTMKKIQDFVEWFYPLLARVGARKAEYCDECDTPIDTDDWYLICGFAYRFHDGCVKTVEAKLAEENKERKENDTGSYVQGTIGALLGALVGAAVWGIVLYLGYVASVVGLLIGWLANKGYTLLHGKRGKGKIAILIVAIIAGVLVGTLAPDAAYLAGMIGAGEIPGATYGDIPAFLLTILAQDVEYARSVGGNVLLGLLFAALGVYGLLKRETREVSDVKIKKLK